MRLEEFRKLLHRVHHTHDLGAVRLRVGSDCQLVEPVEQYEDKKRELNVYYEWHLKESDSCGLIGHTDTYSYACTAEPLMVSASVYPSVSVCRCLSVCLSNLLAPAYGKGGQWNNENYFDGKRTWMANASSHIPLVGVRVLSIGPAIGLQVTSVRSQIPSISNIPTSLWVIADDPTLVLL